MGEKKSSHIIFKKKNVPKTPKSGMNRTLHPSFYNGSIIIGGNEVSLKGHYAQSVPSSRKGSPILKLGRDKIVEEQDESDIIQFSKKEEHQNEEEEKINKKKKATIIVPSTFHKKNRTKAQSIIPPSKSTLELKSFSIHPHSNTPHSTTNSHHPVLPFKNMHLNNKIRTVTAAGARVLHSKIKEGGRGGEKTGKFSQLPPQSLNPPDKIKPINSPVSLESPNSLGNMGSAAFKTINSPGNKLSSNKNEFIILDFMNNLQSSQSESLVQQTPDSVWKKNANLNKQKPASPLKNSANPNLTHHRHCASLHSDSQSILRNMNPNGHGNYNTREEFLHKKPFDFDWKEWFGTSYSPKSIHHVNTESNHLAQNSAVLNSKNGNKTPKTVSFQNNVHQEANFDSHGRNSASASNLNKRRICDEEYALSNPEISENNIFMNQNDTKNCGNVYLSVIKEGISLLDEMSQGDQKNRKIFTRYWQNVQNLNILSTNLHPFPSNPINNNGIINIKINKYGKLINNPSGHLSQLEKQNSNHPSLETSKNKTAKQRYVSPFHNEFNEIKEISQEESAGNAILKKPEPQDQNTTKNKAKFEEMKEKYKKLKERTTELEMEKANFKEDLKMAKKQLLKTEGKKEEKQTIIKALKLELQDISEENKILQQNQSILGKIDNQVNILFNENYSLTKLCDDLTAEQNASLARETNLQKYIKILTEKSQTRASEALKQLNEQINTKKVFKRNSNPELLNSHSTPNYERKQKLLSEQSSKESHTDNNEKEKDDKENGRESKSRVLYNMIPEGTGLNLKNQTRGSVSNEAEHLNNNPSFPNTQLSSFGNNTQQFYPPVFNKLERLHDGQVKESEKCLYSQEKRKEERDAGSNSEQSKSMNDEDCSEEIGFLNAHQLLSRLKKRTRQIESLRRDRTTYTKLFNSRKNYDMPDEQWNSKDDGKFFSPTFSTVRKESDQSYNISDNYAKLFHQNHPPSSSQKKRNFLLYFYKHDL